MCETDILGLRPDDNRRGTSGDAGSILPTMLSWHAYPTEVAEQRLDLDSGRNFPTEDAPPGRVVRLAFDSTGQCLVTMPRYDAVVRPPCRPATVWRPDGTRLHDLPFIAATADPSAVAVGPGGAWVAVAVCDYNAPGGWFNALRLWDTATGQFLAEQELIGTADDFRPLPDGGLLAAVGGNVWRYPAGLASRRERLNKPVDNIGNAVRVAVSVDGSRLAGSSKSRAVIWNDAGKLLFSREHKRSPQNGPIAFHPHRPILAVGHGTVVDLWHYTRPREVVMLAGHKRPVWAVGFGSDGGTVYTAASDGAVIAWDTDTGTQRQRFDYSTGKLYSAAVSPDGLTLALGGDDGRVTVVDIDS